MGSPVTDRPGGLPPPKPPKNPKEGAKEGKESSDKVKESSDKGPDKSGDRGAAPSVSFPLGVANWPGGSFSVSAEKHVFLVILKKGKLSNADELEQEHLAHLSRLMVEGKLSSAGVFATGDRDLQVLIAESREQAERMVQSDPLLKAGYYQDFCCDEITTP